MTALTRWFLAVEFALFGIASVVHAGALTDGYEHSKAATAEAVIAAVLALALIASAIVPGSIRGIGLASQGFALLGTLVGLVMITIGVGPRTGFDLALHAGMVALLLSGLIAMARRRTRAT